MQPTKIAWTEYSSNPIHAYVGNKWGWMCVRKSAACDYCYAENQNMKWGNKLRYNLTNVKKVNWVLRQKEVNSWTKAKPGKAFVEDMSDLHLEQIPEEMVLAVYKGFEKAPQIKFQVLTKRPEQLLAFAEEHYPDGLPSNVWVGTTVESSVVKNRIDVLRKVKANSGVHFLSCEPLIGPMGKMNLRGIQWVIVGGMSGPNWKKSPMDVAWARKIRDQCLNHKPPVAFFFKQSSARLPGREPKLDGRTWHQMPNGAEL